MDETPAMLALADRMLYVVALCGAPVLLASLSIGLVIAIFQAATSINEQTLTFIPKVVVTAGVLLLFGASMLGLIEDFQRDIFAAIAHIGAAAGQ
jgi:flagellar biosynthetic protein FliQ